MTRYVHVIFGDGELCMTRYVHVIFGDGDLSVNDICLT